MPDNDTAVPLWVQEMRAAGYNVRTGTGILPEIPEASFPPPPKLTIRQRVRSFFGVGYRLPR